MFPLFVSASAGFCLIVYFILWPIFNYFRDVKGFRKYPAVNALAGITDLGFMYEAYRGNRTARLTEMHKKHPVIRLGPNSLSFVGLQAIKVRCKIHHTEFRPRC